MKKIIVILMLFSIILSSLSCTQNEQINSDPHTITPSVKEIVLGDKVNSVVLTTKTGEKITFDNTADFYEIFNKIGLEYDVGKKYSLTAEMKFLDQNTSIEGNVYWLDNAQFYEFNATKEGDDDAATFERYNYSKQSENNRSETKVYSKYVYKDEKAFGGMEIGANGSTVYTSDEYPMTPAHDTELGDMELRACYPFTVFNYSGLFTYPKICVVGDTTYDYNDFITREYTLYENYIVLKQTSPFLYFYSWDPEILYKSFQNTDCSITQEAYCNVKTGEIEFIKIYGETLWHSAEYWGKNLKIDMQMCIFDNSESEGNQKVNDLINYIKSNSN